MTRDDIIRFVNDNPLFFLATESLQGPRVRAMMLFRADTSGLYFSTWKDKEVYQQLTDNPSVELCFYSARQGLQVRIRGSANEIKGENLRREVAEKFRFLRGQIREKGVETLAVFCLSKGTASWWNLLDPFKTPKALGLTERTHQL